MWTKLGLCLWFLFIALASGQNSGPEEPEIIRQVVWPTTIPLAMYVDRLPNVPKIYGYQKKHGVPAAKSITIGMYQKTVRFHRDLPPTPVFVYGTSQLEATFPGPTIVALRGVPTHVTWENHLPATHILPWDTTISMAMAPTGVPTVVHLHGGTVAPDSDGSPFAWFTSNFTYRGSAWSQATYTYPNVQHAGNLMYHDHTLGLTRINLLAGLLGAYIIDEPLLDVLLNLPAGPEYDRLLVIADRSFNADGSIYMKSTGVNPDIHPVWRPEYFGDAMTVNGKIWPYLTVERRKYRFRIINACNARYLNLAFSNGLPFTVVGSDSSYLPAPVTTQNIILSVAEILDAVVDFSAAVGSSVELLNSAPYPYPNGSPVGQWDSKIMNFRISPLIPIDPSTVPPVLVYYPPANPAEATATRYLALFEYTSSTGQPTHLYINGKRLTDPVTETPRTGSTELWYVINLTEDDHPLHIHLAMFQAIKMQEIVDLQNFTTCMTRLYDPVACDVASHAVGRVMAVPEYEKTWKDVVKLPPGFMTAVVVRFNLVNTGLPYPFDATAFPDYVYHCHILDHEDNEMIRPLKLLL